MKFYGFLEVKDGEKQVHFEEIIIEAENYKKARKAFEFWLAQRLMEFILNYPGLEEDLDGLKDHSAVMTIELAPRRVLNWLKNGRIKPIKAEELGVLS